MSDEIDIEEHDVMDNPTIKRIFPDLSVIKKEINQYYEEDVPQETTFERPRPETAYDSQSDSHLDIEKREDISSDTHLHIEKQNDIFSMKKLPELEETPKESTNLLNVIILGSKPANKSEKVNQCVKKKQEPKLIVDNVSYFLNRCKRYCKLCLILFPEVINYDLHMYVAHSIDVVTGKKVANQSYKCDSCKITLSSKYALVRHVNKFHRKVSTIIQTNLSNIKKTSSENTATSKSVTGHSCFHCQLLFPSQSSLIEHLYEVLKPQTGSSNLIENPTKAKDTNETDQDTNEGKKYSKRKRCIENIERKKESKRQETIKKARGFREIDSKLKTSTSDNKNKIYKCSTCSEQFNSIGMLKYHVKSIHKTKRTVIRKRKSKPISKKKLYKCFICSKYTVSFRYYSIHMKSDHKFEEVSNVQKVQFDSKCKYCSAWMSTAKIYNTHLSKFHSKQLRQVILSHEMEGVDNNKEVFNKEISFAIKTVLYKCMKCDIFFLSANVAMDHSRHEDMTKNWKCSICQRMFKNKDRDLHVKQHSFSKTLTVYTLSESALSRVLYKCLQCTVHYSEDKFLAHHSKCDTETPNSLYCKVCDILINRDDMDFHQLNHKDKKVQCTDFTVIESDLIDEHSINSIKVSDEKDIENINEENRLADSSQEDKTKFSVMFCHTCNCFLTNYTYKTLKVHTQGKCRHMLKIICKDCGLVVIMATYETHKELHKKKEFNLQNFSFYKLNSKKTITPPIPDYPNCNVCGVHFLRKNAVQTHSCQLQEYKTCNICLIKLTEQAYILHMAFHEYLDQNVINNVKLPELTPINDNLNNIDYKENTCKSQVKNNNKHKDKNVRKESSLDKSRFIFMFCRTCKCFVSNYQPPKSHLEAKCGSIPSLLCQDCGLLMTWKTHQTHKELHKKMKVNIQKFFFYDLISQKQICPPIPDYPNCNVCGVHFLRKNSIRTHSCQLQEYKTCNICLIKLTEQAYKLHMDFHNYSIKNINKKLEHVTEDLAPTNDVTDLTSDITDDSNLKCIFLFSCKSCQIALNTYDNVVQHCQDHYNYKVIKLNLKKCEYCNLIFYRRDYDKHNMLHMNGKYHKESITIVDFDPLYFRYSFDFWVKHIFAYVADDQITKILDNSMYKYECRLKMEETQSGLSGLMLYKCDKCQAVIEPQSLYMHAKNSLVYLCVNLRKHSCSLCGLNFVSLTYRLAHEKEHEGTDRNIKSYRIILFNKVDDIFNEIMFDECKRFILYQCRNCENIVDKFIRKVHKCEEKHLKQCSKCGLLLNDLDYDLHFIRHEELVQFNKDNITVVMFGKTNTLLYTRKKEFRSTFRGTIYDYTFYKCKNCKLCHRRDTCPTGHVCVDDNAKCICTKCGLWFLKLDMKQHSKLHESNLEFDELNINVITFDALSTKRNFEPQETIKVQDDSIKAIEDKSVLSSKTHQNQNDGPEKLDKIYKCVCGLHFLEEINAQQHANSCNAKMKISKQSCFKCDLLFTPGELFNHLLKHHCDKKLQYKFDILIVYKKTVESTATL